ncbi:flavoprotein [Catellatospora bangladeshensis]|uniref:Phosphopantothenoylcysteine synthetase n=1 Tax=Catellatospora bangladeshensis TaxID=310355 RepID=A0A8J3NKF4_9ACTN|nr:flavoprotein [Catellatospora bangladeshensis]GIF81470.1 phosphopantothenoylcysteine synthetase [Catellatospora bangladeshensis]
MTEERIVSADPRLPPLGFRRLLLVAAGSLNAAFLPRDLVWLRTAYPELETQVVLTRSALQFVTPGATGAITGRPALVDEWPTPVPEAVHVTLQQWAQAVLVYPASLNYLARLALGLADSPSLLAIHCSAAPVLVAPALPPGGWDSPVTQGHVTALEARPTVTVLPPVPVRSFTTGRDDAYGPPPFTAVLGTLELHRRRIEEKTT